MGWIDNLFKNNAKTTSTAMPAWLQKQVYGQTPLQRSVNRLSQNANNTLRQGAQAVSRAGQSAQQANKAASSGLQGWMQNFSNSLAKWSGETGTQRLGNFASAANGLANAAGYNGQTGMRQTQGVAKAVPNAARGNGWHNETDYSWLSPNYRNDNAAIMMSTDEALRRENARRASDPSYQAWVSKAYQSPNTQHDLESQWYAQNPRPRSWFEWTDPEYELRARNAPTGYSPIPYGTGYAKMATTPSVPNNNSGNGNSGYGGYGGYGYGGYNYPNYDNAQDINNWYNAMTSWNYKTNRSA